MVTKNEKQKEHRLNSYYLLVVSLLLGGFTAYEYFIEESYAQTGIFLVCTIMMALACVREWRESK